MFPVNRATSHLANQGVSLATLPTKVSAQSSLAAGEKQPLTATLAGHTVDLASSGMAWARQVSTQVEAVGETEKSGMPQAEQAKAWHAYLQAIAAIGFTTWVNEAEVNYSASHDKDQATGVCQVGGYRVGILPVIGLPSVQVSIPRAAIDGGIHLFVLVEIQLDDDTHPMNSQTGQATILSALRRDQIDPNQLAIAGNDYLVEMMQFDLVPEQIQMYLEGLCKGYESAAYQAHAPQAITTPTIPPASSLDRSHLGDRTTNTASLTARTRIFPAESGPSTHEGQSRQQPFDWISLASIGTLPTAPESTEEALPQPATIQPAAIQSAAIQPAAIQSEAPAPEASARKDLSKLLKRFNTGDVDLPQSASGVYADVAITEYKLRLYALVWAVESLLEPELSLFLILGPTQGSYLPMDTQLTVKENNLLLTEQTLRWTSAPTYLYTQVFGTWEEKFTVEIALPYARPLSLPALTFSLETP